MTSSICPQEISFGSTQVIYDQCLMPHLTADIFKPQSSTGVSDIHGQTIGRGEALFFTNAGQNLVLRHYRRGGFVRHFVRDQYFGRQASASRSFIEWRLLANLYHQGLPVPKPVAASYCPAGFFYRADLITCEIENVQPLSVIIRQDQVPVTLWTALGATLRRFHDAQVFHADLNAHNILLDPQEKAYLIDFDRGTVRVGQGWKQANLSRLLRSLQKLTKGSLTAQTTLAGWKHLLAGYRQGNR